jgi:hypothetical protein
MKYTVEMGSCAMTYKTSFIRIGSGIQKLTGQVSQSYKQHGDCISLLSFFQNNESRLTPA